MLPSNGWTRSPFRYAAGPGGSAWRKASGVVTAFLTLQGDREFYAEVGLLTRLRHPNLVCIMGMCNESGQKLGVFEFMPRGSLRELLDKKALSWKERVVVAVGEKMKPYVP